MPRRLRPILVFCLLVLPWAAQADPAAPTAASSAAPENTQVVLPAAMLAPELRRLYEARDHQPAWWAGNGWSEAAYQALRVFAAADQEGLDPRDYDTAGLSQALAATAPSEADIRHTELRLTAATLRYIDHISNGRVNVLRRQGWQLWLKGYRDPSFLLAQGLASADFGAWLAGIAPSDPRYAGLRRALASHRALAETAWPTLPEGPTLEPGMRDARIRVLRRQLTLLGDLPAGSDMSAVPPEGSSDLSVIPVVQTIPAPATPIPGDDPWEPLAEGESPFAPPPPPMDAAAHYDTALVAAVRRFQARHGLAVDERVGTDTVRALNQTPASRVAQIRASMERLRWLPDLGARHVAVNLPAFELRAVADGRTVLNMPVIIGQDDWQTPMISDYIVSLKFAPDWTIPRSIIRAETLPKIRHDPGYLARTGMQIYVDGRRIDPAQADWTAIAAGAHRLRLRQPPGPNNPLGQIRFSLTNGMSIYLHDTPNEALFRRAHRALSHGCVRVADPVALAAFVLAAEPGWTPERIRKAMNSPRTWSLPLTEPVPVHLLYLTAWADEDDVVQFRRDIYDRDAAVLRALSG